MSSEWSLSRMAQDCRGTAAALEDYICEDEPSALRKDELLSAFRHLLKRMLVKGYLNPTSQAKSLAVLSNAMEARTFRLPAVRRICWEYWRLVREGTASSSSLILPLSTYIASGFSPSSIHSEDYPLHRAVFEGRLYYIRNLCLHESETHIFCEIDAVDPLGCSPLMLAVKLRKLEEALVLVDHGANPKFRSNADQPTPLEQSAGLKDKAICRVLLAACQRQQLDKWELLKSKLAAAIRQLPNFELTMKWACKSQFLPFVKHWTPSDTYHIYKQDQDLRCDMTLVGWNRLRAERGHISLLFKGAEGRVFLVDRETGTVREMLQGPNEKVIDVQLSQLLKYQRAKREIRSATMDLTPETDWKGNPQAKRIGPWLCHQFKARCLLDLSLIKRAITLDEHLASITHFEDYFQYCLEMRVRSRASSVTSVVTISPRSFRNVTKTITAHLWLSREFPLSLTAFLPLLSFVGAVSKKAKMLKTLLARLEDTGNGGFPVKSRIPLIMTLKAHVQFEELVLGPLNPTLFCIPMTSLPCSPPPEQVLSLDEYPEINEEDIFQEPAMDSSSRSTMKRERGEYMSEEEEDDFVPTTGEENLDETLDLLPNQPHETCSAPVTARSSQIRSEAPPLTTQQVLMTLRSKGKERKWTKDVDVLLL